MNSLLDTITREHFPHPPATPEQIAAFEARMGWRLDADLRAFYLHCDGAELFRPLPEANYSILSLAEIQETLIRVRRRDQGAVEAASWYPVADCQDSDYVLVDVAKPGGPYRLLDAWHETYPSQVKQIASSFSEFLEKALASNDHLYWLYE
ncbi:SMI1/KNR4 family protein [Pyxidicoccus fallax]|uniref:SMI1/KNR4 family protein n=1 Tax=Pyxidicoccus fallax TaxID=394095 RepID=A0A848M003_9BACT|nr:SMI1/KNR4 family protein [Pyxidicoccus fallax]NMO23209.1 SMI1/KNR4 family protein [Pyxidicoccus fallax]NPC86079.1 SMI1/KNR4 family protein [Pyxidicoccus fallax]